MILYKNTDFGKTGSYFLEKILFGFPSDVLSLLCCGGLWSFLMDSTPSSVSAGPCDFTIGHHYILCRARFLLLSDILGVNQFTHSTP